jgi:hypothetical protein
VHFIPRRFAIIFRFILIVSSVGVFVFGQNAPSGSTEQLYRVDLSSGQVVSSTWYGVDLHAAAKLDSAHGAQWLLVGATGADANGTRKLVYFDSSSREVAVNFYGGASQDVLLGSAELTKLGVGWTARAVADFKGDGSLGVVAANRSSGEVTVYFFGGSQGTEFTGSEPISPLSAVGWNVVGTADLNGDGHPDLILQNQSTRQVRVAYLTGASGTTLTSTQDLDSSDFHGWTASGMQDMNGDGHPDLILANDTTGESIVNYYGGELGVSYLGSHALDQSGAANTKLVVPTGASTSAVSAPTTDSTSTPVLIFDGTGTSSTDVTAVESLVTSMGLAYHTANSSQLDAMSQSELMAYKLFIVPGGNSITIGDNLSKNASATVHSAVAGGLNYLGICAGGFFGGFSAYYNGLDLTAGTWFTFYADYYKGINKAAVEISFPAGQPKLDIYWQDGPQLSGWGNVVGKYSDGTPAVVEGYMGDGFVILSGVHPEAPASWRYGMTFTTPLDTDLAFASSLVKAAMNRKALAHF